MNPQNRAVIPNQITPVLQFRQKFRQQQAPLQSRKAGRREMVWVEKAVTSRGRYPRLQSSQIPNEHIETSEEYVGLVTVANQPNFNCVQYPLNAGNVSLFPRLAQLAKLYEKYSFEYVHIIYQRAVSEFNSSFGTGGNVFLGFDSDAADAKPSSAQQILSTMPNKMCLGSDPGMSMAIPPSMLKNKTDAYFVRPGGLPGGADIKTYDVGNINVATELITTNGTVGRLLIRYKCRLFIPVLPSTTGAPANNQVAQFSQVSVNGGATTVATTIPLATADVNGLSAVNTAGSIVLTPGNYLLDVTDNVVFSQQNQFDTTQLQVKVNGTQLNNLIDVINWPAVVTEAGSVSHHLSGYVSVNGTDTLTIVATDTLAAGTAAHTTTLRIVAI